MMFVSFDVMKSLTVYMMIRNKSTQAQNYIRAQRKYKKQIKNQKEKRR